MKAIVNKEMRTTSYLVFGINLTIEYKQEDNGNGYRLLINDHLSRRIFKDWYQGIYFPSKEKCELFIKDILENFEVGEVINPYSRRYNNEEQEYYDYISEQIQG